VRRRSIWSGLVFVKILRYRMAIDDHAAVRDWIARTIAAISPARAHNVALCAAPTPAIRARRVYQPAALP